jgi:hypothetical protein
MENLATTAAAGQCLVADGYDLEKQLQIARRRYAQARESAYQAREEWRASLVHPAAKPEDVQAARAKFDAVAARCSRLRTVIEELEDRLD